MALEDIIKKIENDSGEDAKRLEAEAEAEVKKILDQANNEAKKKSCRISKKGDEKADRVRKRILQIADLEARKIILTAKRQVIADTFEQARKRLEEAEDYRDLIGKMLLVGAETGEEEVLIAAGDRKRIDKGLIDTVNKKLEQQKNKGSLTLSGEDAPITGGFILRRGKVEIDNSFASLIKSRKDALEIKVAEILFS